MNILIISQYFWPENFKINDLAKNLVKKGYAINVLTGKPNYPEGKFYDGYTFFSPRKETYNGIKIRRIPLIPRGKANNFRLILNYFSFAFTACFYVLFHHKKYDAVFVFATSPITVAFPAMLYRRFHKTKTLLWVLDLWPESVAATTTIRSKYILKMLGNMVKGIYKRMDKILISSRGFQASIEEKGVSREKIWYVPNWAEDFYEQPQRIDREKYGKVMPEGFKAMFFGNIGEAQDCEALLATAEYLKDINSNVQLVMVGDGRKRMWLEKEVQKKQLNNVHFLGKFPPKEMPNLIVHADVLLISLKDEPIFALTVPARIQTALASAKPIAVMLNGEGAAIVSEAKAGLTCNAGDARSFAKNLHSFSKYAQEELLIMGISGKQYYESHFKCSKVISEIEQLLYN
jgi:glycosyltransferase involved in cell wall biosynthesis